MRKEFTAWLEAYAGANPDVLVLTGDLGYAALEGTRDRIGDRFVNMGVSEQNMISVAAGLASEGLRPICYSIAPFAVFRPAEQIRLDVCLHGLNVKIVGNGGGYGYGIMGATHHALEDIAVLSSFPGMSCFLPVTGADVATVADTMMADTGPGYLRLNMGTLPPDRKLEAPFAPIRRILPAPEDPKLTIVALGPIALHALDPRADVWVVSRLPFVPHRALLDSVWRTGRLLVVEEHVERGGLAEHLALAVLKAGLSPMIWTRSAAGYPSKTYGSQAFHQRESGLDAASIAALVEECLG